LLRPGLPGSRTRQNQRARGPGTRQAFRRCPTHASRSDPAQAQLPLVTEEVIPSQLIRTTQAKRCRQLACTPSSMKTAEPQDARRSTNRARRSRRHAEETNAATSSPGSSKVLRSVVAKRHLRSGRGSRADGSARRPAPERDIDLPAHPARTGRGPIGTVSPTELAGTPVAGAPRTIVGGWRRRDVQLPATALRRSCSRPTRDAPQNKLWFASVVTAGQRRRIKRRVR
jgi:hypothetical protein